MCDFLKHLCKSVQNGCLIYVIVKFSQKCQSFPYLGPYYETSVLDIFFIIVSFCLSNVVASISRTKPTLKIIQ